MTDVDDLVPDSTVRNIEQEIARSAFAELTAFISPLPTGQIVAILERLDSNERAVAYRMLPKGRALEVFEVLDPSLQSDLVLALQDEQTAELFADLDPDDRVELLDELPANLARRLLQGLPADERDMTAEILGYPQGSIGRRMSPEFVRVNPK